MNYGDMYVNEEIERYIEKSVLCWLATSDKHGQPNVSPKEIFSYYGNELFLIANIASPRSVKNILSNEKVAVSFIDIFEQKGYQLKGTARIVKKDEANFEDKLSKLSRLTGSKFKILDVIEISISSAKPILAPSYMFYPQTDAKDQIEAAKKRYRL